MDDKSFAKQCGVVSPSAGCCACSRSIVFKIRCHVSAPAMSPSSSSWSVRSRSTALTRRFLANENIRNDLEPYRAAPTLGAWTTKLWTEPSGPPFGDCMRRPSGPAGCRRFATEWRFLIRRPRSHPGRRAKSPRAAPPVIDTRRVTGRRKVTVAFVACRD
jgi:hypothetical protein